jgi:hypothetical protein
MNLLSENNYRTGPRLLELKELRSDRAPVLRLPRCQELFERLGLDVERGGTVCQGCRYSLEDGCPNTRAWSLDRFGDVKPVCQAKDLVYCKHYDCGCDHCANYLQGTPMPLASRG